jgi:hypothetical protein
MKLPEVLVDIVVEIRGETDDSYRVFDGARTVWLPKSQVENNNDGTFTMPLWLAKDKELI